METVKGWIASVRKWAGKKLIVAAVGMGIAALKAKHPDWPLPDVDFTRDVLIALLGAHTLTDIMAILKTAGKEVLSGRAADGA